MITSAITSTVENVVLQWNEASAGDGDFGARTFLYRRKEFGHIHWSGDVDIVFPKRIAAALVKRELVKKHFYIPDAGITYSVRGEEEIPFAISLMRFSYLIHFAKANGSDSLSQTVFKNEISKLPEELSSIYFEQR
jgi:hypothetical protein